MPRQAPGPRHRVASGIKPRAVCSSAIPCLGGTSRIRRATRLATSACQASHNQAGLGPTEPCTGCSRFLLSSGCEWGEYYRVAHRPGLAPSETQIACRTCLACNSALQVILRDVAEASGRPTGVPSYMPGSISSTSKSTSSSSCGMPAFFPIAWISFCCSCCRLLIRAAEVLAFGPPAAPFMSVMAVPRTIPTSMSGLICSAPDAKRCSGG